LVERLTVVCQYCVSVYSEINWSPVRFRSLGYAFILVVPRLLPLTCCLLPVARCPLPVTCCPLPFAFCCLLLAASASRTPARHTPHATNHTPQATRHTDQPPTRPTCRLLCLPDRRLVSPVAGRRSPASSSHFTMWLSASIDSSTLSQSGSTEAIRPTKTPVHTRH
jgi:hypothetical protein